MMKSRFLLAITLMATLTACVAPITVPAPDYPNKETPSHDNTKNQNDNVSIIVPVPIIIGKQPQTKENSVHVCTMSAFTYTYKAEDTNRGKARLNVKKQCLANFHEMHCPDENIHCTEY